MKDKLRTIPGSITAPRGFLASGVFCDIKRLGTGAGSDKGKKRDLALIVSKAPAAVAGMFTTNQVCAAPVKVCLEGGTCAWAFCDNLGQCQCLHRQTGHERREGDDAVHGTGA